MRTYLAKPNELTRKWYVVDADGKTLGRLSARVAAVLRGKHKPTFTPNIDTGDHVVIINAEKVQLTAGKLRSKVYIHHTGYPGGLKTVQAEALHARRPTELLKRAITGMLPKTSLGKQMARKLKIYAGPEHPHSAQGPEPLTL
jgi:large subunit ribosomal protein L13